MTDAGDFDLDWDTALSTWRRELDAGRWVTLAEAVDAGGVSRSALRSWYRTGEIPSRLEEGPHGPQRLVPLDAVLERAARTRPRSGGAKATPADDTVEHLVGLLGRQIEKAEARADHAEAALRDALARAAAAEAERDALRRQLGH